MYETREASFAEFRGSDFLRENLVVLQIYAIEMVGTVDIDVCAKVEPSFNKEDLKVSELYRSTAKTDFKV